MRRGKTKDRIVQAAIKVFSENGYEKSHVEDILDVANVCKGTFYRYFRSKTDLLEKACQEFLFSFGGEWYEFINNTDDPIKGLGFHVDFIFTIVSEEHTASSYFELWARGMRTEASRSHGTDGELPGSAMYRTLRENITRFYKAGKDRDLLRFAAAPELMASLLIAVVDGMSIQFLINPKVIRIIEAREQIKKIFIHDLMLAGEA